MKFFPSLDMGFKCYFSGDSSNLPSACAHGDVGLQVLISFPLLLLARNKTARLRAGGADYSSGECDESGLEGFYCA